MHDEVKGVVEGADRNHHARGLSPRKSNAVGGSSIELHRYFRPMFAPDALDTVLDPVNRPLKFYPCIRQGLATFEYRHAGERIEAIAHQLDRAF